MASTYPPTSGRFNTPEGFLYRNAVLTRSGPFEYLRSELGLEGEGEVTVHRSQESISHPDTLKRLRGAPITLGHPAGGVTPDSWSELAVGHVVGEPRVVGNTVVADVVLGSQKAIDAYKEGINELSIGGYEMEVSPLSNGEFMSHGSLESNHVGMVPAGRAGSGVRIFDIKPSTNKERQLTPDEIQESIRKAIADAIPKGNDSTAQVSQITDAVALAIKPLTDGVTKILSDAEKAEQQRKAKVAVDKAIDAALAKQKSEFEIVIEARPLISDEDWAKLPKDDPKVILAAALGDQMPEGDVSLDYLRGMVAMAVKAKATQGGSLPAGVAPYTDGVANDARTAAIDEFAKLQDEAYAKVGGV